MKLNLLLAGLISVLFLTCCSEGKINSTKELMTKQTNSLIKNMCSKYDAHLLDASTLDSYTDIEVKLQDQKIIIDSTIVSVYFENNEWYVNLAAIFGDVKLYAKLKCDQKILQRIDECKNSKVYAAADVSKIKKTSGIYECDFLDEQNPATIKSVTEILIAGNCLNIVEKPADVI